jgi:sugar/nucleoside kinase (ribokinase family)
MSLPDSVVLCAGIAVQDLIFRVQDFPPPGGKARASAYLAVNGGCAGNAAIAVARLGGRARYVGPLGDAQDAATESILAQFARDGVDTAGVLRIAGAVAPVSAILVDAAGERMIATRVEPQLDDVRLEDPEPLLDGISVLLADNRYGAFVLPLCAAARRRGIPVVLDADRPRDAADPLFRSASHVIFSREGLQGMADDLAAGLSAAAQETDAFLAVTDGAGDLLWMRDGAVQRMSVPKLQAVDTLAAGDVFHGAFALALAEGRDAPDALRFAAATASLKCTRFGGVAGAPGRAEVEKIMAQAWR